MTETIQANATEYTVIILARTDGGEKVKLCHIELPKDAPAKIMSTTRSFATLKGITELAGEVIEDAENIYLRGVKDEANARG
jgi:hypothetical protein